jgi:hypothetical protein
MLAVRFGPWPVTAPSAFSRFTNKRAQEMSGLAEQLTFRGD